MLGSWVSGSLLLLGPNSLTVSNHRLKPYAFKLIRVYVLQIGLLHTLPIGVTVQVLILRRQAKNLQILDLSLTVLEKKTVDHIVVCLSTAPEPGLVSLRLDDCSLCPNALEVLDESPFDHESIQV